MGSLVGRVALVTGGGSGIGRATALAFGRKGVKVVVSDVNPEGGEETVSKISSAGGESIFSHADVPKSTDVEALINEAVEHHGRLDAAFNNAGVVLGRRRTHEISEEDWDRLMSINLKGVFLCMKYELHQMLKQGGGVIVNTSSASGLVGIHNAAAYSSSKHGVMGLTRTAALDYAKDGIRINAVCPDYIRTALIEGILSDPELVSQAISREPIGRIGKPEEVADAVVWLCSDDASYVTGTGMSIDGGAIAGIW